MRGRLLFFSIIFLAFFIFLDVVLVLPLGSVLLSPHLAMLFLLYHGFRKPVAYNFYLLIVFIILSHPFTGLNYATVFLSYTITLFLIHRLRSQMFAEAYMTYAFWVFVFSFLLQTLMNFAGRGTEILVWILTDLMQHLVTSVVVMMLTVPFFIAMDLIFDRPARVVPRTNRDDIHF